jgi:predicted oxidoreductase
MACRPELQKGTEVCLRDISGSIAWTTGSGGWPSRSALLESQESAGRKKHWLRRFEYRMHTTAHADSVGWTQVDGGRRLFQRAGQRPIN